MPENRYRWSITTPDGETISLLEPPPEIVELIKENPQAEYIWKGWLNNVYKFVGALSYRVQEVAVNNYTAAEIAALSPENGWIVYNTTTNQFNFYENGAWVTK